MWLRFVHKSYEMLVMHLHATKKLEQKTLTGKKAQSNNHGAFFHCVKSNLRSCPLYETFRQQFFQIAIKARVVSKFGKDNQIKLPSYNIR